MGIDSLLAIIQDYAPHDKEAILRAYEFASEVHKGVIRKSGDPYITHPVAVACILAEMHADVETIMAGLLHDTIEDSDNVSKELLASKFGQTVANLVDGVTKLPKLSIGNDKSKTDAASNRKIFENITFDIRILIIKLADRLHNMRTLEFHKPNKQEEISLETMNIFVPFANLIGAYTFKQELEDLAFKYLNPKEYLEMVELEKKAYLENFDIIDQAICQVSQLLNSKNIPFQEKLKIKNYYGLYKRLKTYQDISQVHDLFSIKFMVNDIPTCYYLKDEINRMYPYLKKKEKDYISHPKSNMYKSLHTSVMAPNDRILQFQIKTPEMYQINAYGLTAYWDLLKFNNAAEHMQNDARKLQFFPILEELVKDHEVSNEEFNNVVEKDILSDRINVRTPMGDIIDLSLGSTPVDFAFKIHTDVGLNIIASRVNGVEVPLNYKLKDKDVVEVISDPNYTGTREDIYNMCNSISVKRKIRKYNESR